MRDPKSLIDRKVEQELFRDLVSFTSPARMLIISAEGGTGKSSLLQRLHYNCRREIKPAIADCLIELDKLGEPSPFRFVEQIVKRSSIGDLFARFSELNKARTFRIPDAFMRSGDVPQSRRTPARLTTTTSVSGPLGERSNVTGMYINQADFRYEDYPEFTLDQEQFAQETCINAFFEDLRAICAVRPLVLILDAWEQCNLEMREWIIEEILEKHCFHPDKNLRPDKLAIVIAGRPYTPNIEEHGLSDDDFCRLFGDDQEFTTCVLSRTSLSKWEKEHVKEFLILNGYDTPTETDISWIQEKLVENRWPLSRILKMIELAKSHDDRI